MNIEKIIRFGFASRRRKIMTLVIAGAAGVSSLAGLGGTKESPKQTAATTSTTASAPAAGAQTVADISYPNCDAVRAAGKAPLHRGDPGYSTKLDRDGDGVACS